MRPPTADRHAAHVRHLEIEERVVLEEACVNPWGGWAMSALARWRWRCLAMTRSISHTQAVAAPWRGESVEDESNTGAPRHRTALPALHSSTSLHLPPPPSTSLHLPYSHLLLCHLPHCHLPHCHHLTFSTENSIWKQNLRNRLLGGI